MDMKKLKEIENLKLWYKNDIKYWGSQSPSIQIEEGKLGFEKMNKKIRKKQKPDKIWASHPLQKIELYYSLHQYQDHKNSDLKNFKWKVWIYSFIDSIGEVLKLIYRLYKTQFSEYNRRGTKFQKKKNN